MKTGEFTKEYILSIPKEINENKCWIPNLVPLNTGYILITIKQKQYYLHRAVLCLWYNIDYNDKKIVTRHNKDCSHSCFNPEHLKSGTDKDNTEDSVLYGNHANASKECCPKCNGPYSKIRLRHGAQKGKIIRYCKNCRLKKNRRVAS